MLVYGIPEFRLPKAIVQKEIDGLKAMGVEIETNMVIGKVLSIDELFENGLRGRLYRFRRGSARASWAFRARTSRACIPPTSF